MNSKPHYEDVSYWLETSGDLTPRPRLEASEDVDIAILGAGYSGLWSAYYLLREDPSLRIAILEQEIAGFGASGRNGAWCSAKLSTTNGELERRYGREKAQHTIQVLRDTVDEVGAVCKSEDIDAQFRKGGLLQIARGPQELPTIRSAWEKLSELDLEDGCELLSADELAGDVRINKAQGALFDPNCATIHPGLLVRDLARVVESYGATIYEQTRVENFEYDPIPKLQTQDSEVRANVVIMAGEAYLSQLPQLHRQVLPIYSLITLTEPISEERWREIGWNKGQCLSSCRLSVDYLSRTRDNRILFGGRGAPYHFGSKIRPEFDRHQATHEMLQEQFGDWFPSLRGVQFTHSWGGPVGAKRDWMPTASYDQKSGIAYAYGYTGQGVAVTNLAGRILAEKITGNSSELATLPMADHYSPSWEVEPLRWAAVRYIQEALMRIDHRTAKTGNPPTGRSLAERLSRH